MKNVNSMPITLYSKRRIFLCMYDLCRKAVSCHPTSSTKTPHIQRNKVVIYSNVSHTTKYQIELLTRFKFSSIYIHIQKQIIFTFKSNPDSKTLPTKERRRKSMYFYNLISESWYFYTDPWIIASYLIIYRF